MKGHAVGSGSFGVVNLAMNKSTGELFIAKSALSGVGLECLENEANIIENLDSPYIIRCLGRDFSNEANGDRKLNLFLEFMAGGSLSDVVEKFGGALDESIIRLYTKEILHGLNYLHNNGIVHCDLKCKNVLLGSSGNIKLADFGCAKRLNSSNFDKGSNSWQSICGTPLWMAPEILRHQGLDFASDIWSLGCTIIEMATGRPPWSDQLSNPMAAVLKIACSDETPHLPNNFSKEGLDFLAKCLQRNPKMRWTSEELLDHPFVSGNSEKSCSCNGHACSPTSILDDGLDEEDNESDKSESPNWEELPSRIPFLTRCSSERWRLARRQQRESDSQPSENWITVRSS